MFRWFFLFVTVWLLHGGVVTMAAKPESSFPKEDQLERTLQGIIIPRIDFRGATVQEAVDYLLGEARRVDPRGGDIHVTVRLGPPVLQDATSKSPAAASPVPSAPAPAAADGLEDARTSVTLSKIPLLEALRFVAGVANLKLRVEADGASLVPTDDPDPMFTRDIRVPSDLYPVHNDEDRRHRSEILAYLKKDARQFLIDDGIIFEAGAAAILTDDAARLTVRNTRAQIQAIEYKMPAPAVDDPLMEARKRFRPEQTRRRAKGISLPSVNFADVPLNDAVKRLQSLGIRHDLSTSKTGRGVKILFEAKKPFGNYPGESVSPKVATVAEHNEPGFPYDSIPKISYSSSKVSLWDATQAVAGLGGYDADAYADGIRVRYRELWDDEGVMETVIPPGILPEIESKLFPPESGKTITRRWLSAGTSPLPPGSVGVFVHRGRRLIVKGKEETIRAVGDAVEEAWIKYYTTEAVKKRAPSAR